MCSASPTLWMPAWTCSLISCAACNKGVGTLSGADAAQHPRRDRAGCRMGATREFEAWSPALMTGGESSEDPRTGSRQHCAPRPPSLTHRTRDAGPVMVPGESGAGVDGSAGRGHHAWARTASEAALACPLAASVAALACCFAASAVALACCLACSLVLGSMVIDAGVKVETRAGGGARRRDITHSAPSPHVSCCAGNALLWGGQAGQPE